ncbi:hypothetical protein GWI33_019931 [Rhynchophorus ferrugineus]|uniref:Uncharacterized protein n=1 Tax=Rhynchophorus ferrugineus TaxID=354439 RepID=A0A834HRN8_RHYFE|nr:hypothetical protein GWI33_019931 [Rhynchophorus ferrugineus]
MAARSSGTSSAASTLKRQPVSVHKRSCSLNRDDGGKNEEHFAFFDERNNRTSGNKRNFNEITSATACLVSCALVP